jgi:hypothetical protein
MFQSEISSLRAAKRDRVRCQRRERADDASQGLEHALLKVAICRYGMFVKKFGRDPKPEEPLFFDPACDAPVEANRKEMRRQVIEAARSVRVDAGSLLTFLKLEETNPV